MKKKKKTAKEIENEWNNVMKLYSLANLAKKNLLEIYDSRNSERSILIANEWIKSEKMYFCALKSYLLATKEDSKSLIDKIDYLNQVLEALENFLYQQEKNHQVIELITVYRGMGKTYKEIDDILNRDGYK